MRGVSDQLTLSDTWHSSSKRAAMGISTKGKSPVGSPGCSPHDGSLLSPGGTTTGRLLLDQPSAPVEAASHDLTVVRLLSVPGVRQGELVGHRGWFATSSTTQSPLARARHFR